MAHIVVDEERCKGCEICIATCPEHVIAVAEHFNSQGYRPAVLADAEGQCTGCTLCARMCPDVAIAVYR
ncbi:MAG: 4Fe-4S dicluster domain-containing protein [Chloroflexota bacterium]